MNEYRGQTFRVREAGHALLLTFIFMVFLFALSGAHITVVVKNQQASRFFQVHSQLRQFAESGLDLANLELKTGKDGGDGRIGTDLWDPLFSDFGADGRPGTNDFGEGDGLPTPGEPNLDPIPVGVPDIGALLIAYTHDGPGTSAHIVATAFIPGENSATVGMYSQPRDFRIPRVGAVVSQSGTAFDFSGRAFSIDGTDTNPNGSPGPGPDTVGIVTTEGTNLGENADLVLLQIPNKHKRQIRGAGGIPSVGEHPDADPNTTIDNMPSSSDTKIPLGTVSDLSLGSADDYKIASSEGNLHLSGNGTGYGVLIVHGDLTISGSLTFQGLVIVEGDVRLTGGGSSIAVTGSLMVSSTLDVSGTTDVRYSSRVLDNVENLLAQRNYEVVYWEGEL